MNATGKTKKTPKEFPDQKVMTRPRRLQLMLIFAVVIIVFAPCLRADFTNWDELELVLTNPLVQHNPIEGLGEVFRIPVYGRYYPLTMWVYQWIHTLFGFKPAAYHLVNVLLHLLNTWLVFLIFTRLRVATAVRLIVTTLFALHPLQVEAVAWVGGLKDVLAAFFFLWGIYIYTTGYALTGSVSRRRHIKVFLLTLLSLLAKPAAVMMPFVLLIIDAYHRRRLTREQWLEKIPYVGLFLMFAVITVRVADQAGGLMNTASYTLPDRFILSLYAVGLYLAKLVAPFRLTVFHPLPVPEAGVFPTEVVMTALLVFVLIMIAFSQRNKVIRLAFLYFLVMLLPCLHIIRVNTSIMYERFAYLPSLGVFVLVAGLFHSLLDRPHKVGRFLRWILMGAIGIYLGHLAVMVNQRCLIWRSSETLWTDAMAKYPTEITPYIQRGMYYTKQDRFEKAEQDFKKAIQLNPTVGQIYMARAWLHFKTKDLDRALMDLTAAIRLGVPGKEKLLTALINRGVLFAMKGEYWEAVYDYTDALDIAPHHPNVLFNRAIAFYKLKRYDYALKDLAELLQYWPDHVLAHELLRTIQNELKSAGTSKEENKTTESSTDQPTGRNESSVEQKPAEEVLKSD